MNLERRLYYRITEGILRLLASLAEKEREDFFRRNPSAASLYRDRFVAAALCQGAALHFLGRGKGVKDLDVHIFYIQHPKRRQLSRAVYSVTHEFPEFGPRRVDFVRSVVPERIVAAGGGNPVRVLRAFLDEEPTTNAYYLAQKAVIGLLPDFMFGTVVWPA